jgi:hypothetical protein
VTNRQLPVKFRAGLTALAEADFRPLSGSSPGRKIFTLAVIVASQQENYATIANYLGIELRYMDAGE